MSAGEIGVEVVRLEEENRILKGNLRYLASITAATAEDLLGRKSTGKRERERQASICNTAALMMKGFPAWRFADSDAHVIKRLEAVLDRHINSEGERGAAGDREGCGGS